jgi:hypothetical protein
MALLDVQAFSLAGNDLTYAAATGGGDTVQTGTTLHVKNGSGGAITVTIDCPNACSFGVTDNAHDKVVSVPAGENRFIPVEARFGNASGIASISYSGVTSLTIAAFRQ